jgi:hypothetical protein
MCQCITCRHNMHALSTVSSMDSFFSLKATQEEISSISVLPYILLCCMISSMINTFCLNYKNYFLAHKEQGYRSQYSIEITCWMTRVSESDRGKNFISFPRGPDRLQLSPVLFNSELLPRGKAVVLDTDHSPQHSAEFMNMWSYISTPPRCPYGLHRDNFTFAFALLFQHIPRREQSLSKLLS